MPSVETKRDEALSRLSDAQLVSSIRDGESSAFAAIMSRYNQRLYRIARGIMRDEAEAEDVLQEAYVRAFAAMRSFRGEAELGTWLSRIVMNEALTRKRRRRPTEDIDALDRAVLAGEPTVVMFPRPASESGPEIAAARAEIRRMLEHAIDELPDTFRLVYVLREIECMSVEETAAHLGLRPETVKTRLHRARRLLRRSLDDTLADALSDTFPFRGARCAGVTETVLARLGIGERSIPHR